MSLRRTTDTSTRRCPRCHKRLDGDPGQHERTGQLEAVYRCGCGYTEPGQSDWSNPIWRRRRIVAALRVDSTEEWL